MSEKSQWLATVIRIQYPTDLSDAQWHSVESLVPAVRQGGRPAKWTRRDILDAILFVAGSGGTWRLLPADFPPWHSVYHYYRLWRRDGTLEEIFSALREQPCAERTDVNVNSTATT